MNIATLTKQLIQRLDQEIDAIARHPMLDRLAHLKQNAKNNLISMLDSAAQHSFIEFIDEHSKKLIAITRQIYRFINATISKFFQLTTLTLEKLFCSRPAKHLSAVLKTIFITSYEIFDWVISLLITTTKSSLLWILHLLIYWKNDVLSIYQQSFIGQKINQYALLIRFNRPIGTLLLLWPTLIALWIAAEGWPEEKVLIVFVLCVFLMRSAGCAINDYADRNIDNKVQRTKNRPLASRAITATEALWIFAALSLTAFTLVLTMNKLTIVMSFVGLALAVSYPFMKRHHYLPQVHLGAAFGWAVPMAYAAQANELADITWLLFIATVLWATAYDTMYAMVDRDDDIKIGVKSTAILFGASDKIIIGAIQCFLILDLILIGLKLKLGGLYYLGILVACGFAVYQQYLIKDRDKELCFKAFLNNNWLGLALFAGVFLEYQIGGFS